MIPVSKQEMLEKYLHALAQGVRGGSVYRHYKGGVYHVLSISLRESDLEPLVHYAMDNGVELSRPLSEWLSTVDVDGQPTLRYVRER